MKVNALNEGIKKGDHTAILFTQTNCSWCDKMKESIIDLDLPAQEVKVTSDLIKKFDITVSPTLVISSDKKNEVLHVPGYKTASELEQIIDKF